MTILRRRYRQSSLGICLICFLLNDISLAENGSGNSDSGSSGSKPIIIAPEGRALFNPRVDYNNQWMPVGHSDPLKNEPTFDYSPPTMERVRYWSEYNNDESSSLTTSNTNENKNEPSSKANNNNLNEKSEILILGVPMKHTLYPHNNHATNQLTPTDSKSSNRRSSPYYPPEPSRVLTPPPLQGNAISYDQASFTSEHAQMPANYWNNELPASYPDAYSEESASYLTVIRPKTSQNPYTTTLYNKDVRNSIYHLAANVNSLEASDKKSPWVHSLLQKEVSFQPQATTPQIVVAYSPKVFNPKPAIFNNILNEPQAAPFTLTTEMPIPISTTTAPISTTTESIEASDYPFKSVIIPTRAPLYLIIQGHSKVKTYGAENVDNAKAKHEPKMVPVTTNKDPVVKHVVSQDSRGNEIQVKHLHKIQTPIAKVKSTTPSTKRVTNSPVDSLLSLLDKSFAGFTLNGDRETKSKSGFELKKSNEQNLSKIAEKKTTTFKTTLSTIAGPTTVRPSNDTEATENVYS